MKIRLQDTDIDEMLIEQQYPDRFQSDNGAMSELTYSGDFFFGKGEYRVMHFEGFHIGFGRIDMVHRPIIQVQSDFETVEMHFAIKGESISCSNDNSKYIFGCNQHNLLYANGFSGTTEWLGMPDMQIFEVNLLPLFFKKYLPDEKAFISFINALERKKSGCLSPHNFPITIPMMQCIREIIYCNKTGVYKRMLVESKVIELLMLQLEQISSHDCHALHQLKKTDIEKMYAVKEILEQNLGQTSTLIDLARKVGTNEFTLKKGFKELFGTTVFGYWQELKMQEARKMLLDYGMSVKEVAEHIGYQHPQHFTAAFKKKFGIVPSKLNF